VRRAHQADRAPLLGQIGLRLGAASTGACGVAEGSTASLACHRRAATAASMSRRRHSSATATAATAGAAGAGATIGQPPWGGVGPERHGDEMQFPTQAGCCSRGACQGALVRLHAGRGRRSCPARAGRRRALARPLPSAHTAGGQVEAAAAAVTRAAPPSRQGRLRRLQQPPPGGMATAQPATVATAFCVFCIQVAGAPDVSNSACPCAGCVAAGRTRGVVPPCERGEP